MLVALLITLSHPLLSYHIDLRGASITYDHLPIGTVLLLSSLQRRRREVCGILVVIWHARRSPVVIIRLILRLRLRLVLLTTLLLLFLLLLTVLPLTLLLTCIVVLLASIVTGLGDVLGPLVTVFTSGDQTALD